MPRSVQEPLDEALTAAEGSDGLPDGSSAKASTSSAEFTGSAVPGTCGALTFSAMWRAATLSPSLEMAAGGGPIHVIPALITAMAKSEFSERKPYPG